MGDVRPRSCSIDTPQNQYPYADDAPTLDQGSRPGLYGRATPTNSRGRVRVSRSRQDAASAWMIGIYSPA